MLGILHLWSGAPWRTPVTSRCPSLSKGYHKQSESSRSFFSLRILHSELIQPIRQLLVFVRVQVGIGIQRCLHRFMPQPVRDLQCREAHVDQPTGVVMPEIMEADRFQACSRGIPFQFFFQCGFCKIEDPVRRQDPI